MKKKKTSRKTNYSNSKSRPNKRKVDTSSEAFKKKKDDPSYKAEWRYTLEVLQRKKRATRLMLSEATGYPVNKITQYVKMILQKKFAKEEVQKDECAISKSKAYYLIID